MEIMRWVQEKLECDREDMESLFNSSTALNFLLVWNIYEIELFNKYCTKLALGNVAQKLSSSSRVQELQTFIEYFHDRYFNDRERYRHLKYDNRNVVIPDSVIERSLNSSSLEEKIHFLLFVLFRYRNNMFHGNKGLRNWLNYDQQIKCCTEAMCIIVDMNRELQVNNPVTVREQ